MSEPKYLLGNGERLSAPTERKSGGSPKKYPYGFSEALERISSGIRSVSDYADGLINEACPSDKIVFSLTLHPRLLSKSDFPDDLFRSTDLRVVGGRSRYVEPEKWGTTKGVGGAVTDCLFVATNRSSLRSLPETMARFSEGSKEGAQLQTIEAINVVKPVDRIKRNVYGSQHAFEVVLHSDGDENVLDQFYTFAAMYEGVVDRSRVRFGGGVIFVPVKLERDRISEVAHYSFLRAIRPMPRLRTFRPPVLREGVGELPQLPDPGVTVGEKRVAIFDGGIPASSPVLPWVNYIEPIGIGAPNNEALGHGEAVTSAFLFGHLTPTSVVSIPPARVDHIRVIDRNTGRDGDYECYDALERIVTHLQSATLQYEYINLSLGPDMPVEDDEINAWSSTLDEVVGRHGMLVCCAAGNTGERDAESMLNRIQPPSDGVNVLSVGACDSPGDDWRRSPYSSVGPGRTPGVAKPDGVMFGGTFERPFGVVSTVNNGLSATQGTSFASPLALRSAVATSVITEAGRLDALAIRALMIHTAEAGENPAEEAGWGRFQSDSVQMLTCDDSEVSVLYRGVLPLKEYLRAPIPLPEYVLHGGVELTATLIISPEVDAAYVNAYTRAGLQVVFRPDSGKVAKAGGYGKSESFFSATNMYKAAEYQLRADGHKWEPCWKATKRKQGRVLNEPCFDIYYHTRLQGRPDTEALPIPYAFVVTVRAPKIKTLYEDTLSVYADILTPIEPTVTVPIDI